MSKLIPVAFAFVAATVLAGCNAMTADPYPVAAGPNPAPPAGYRVECVSTPAFASAPYPRFNTGCRQIFAPSRSAVVRARG